MSCSYDVDDFKVSIMFKLPPLATVRNCQYQILPCKLRAVVHRPQVWNCFLGEFMGTKKEPSAKLRKGIYPGCICGTSAQLNKKIHIVLHLQIGFSARVCTF